MSTPIQLPVMVDGLSTLKDGSVKIVLETRELSGDEAAKMFDLRNSEAWAIIAPNPMSEADVKLPTERADPAVGKKTPSQRLRAVLYRLWEQNPKGVDFESFYRLTLEKVIDQFKAKLDD